MKKFLSFYSLLALGLLLCFSCEKDCDPCDQPQPGSLIVDYGQYPGIKVTYGKPPEDVYWYQDPSTPNYKQYFYYYGDTISVNVSIDPKGIEVDSVIIYKTLYGKFPVSYISIDTVTNINNSLNPTFSFNYSPKEEDNPDNELMIGLNFVFDVYYKKGSGNLANANAVYRSDFSFDGKISSISRFNFIYPKVHEELYLYNMAGSKGNLFVLDVYRQRPFDYFKEEKLDNDFLGSFVMRGTAFFIKLKDPSDRWANAEFIAGIQSNYKYSSNNWNDYSDFKYNLENDYTKFLRIEETIGSKLTPYQLVNYFKQHSDQASYEIDEVKVGDKLLVYFNSSVSLADIEAYNITKQDHYGLLEVLYISQDGMTEEQGGSDEDYIKFKISVF